MPSIRPVLATMIAPLCLLVSCTAVDEAPANQIEARVITKGTLGVRGSGPEAQYGWSLIWSDDFEGDEVDSGKWGFDVDCWGGGNEERQCYTDRTENASIENGKLVITARREDYTGPALPPRMRANAGDAEAVATKPYTSARLVTKGKAAWQYGRIEVRAKLPQGQGTWPAIWMLPEDSAYGSWAKSGEIDILEAVNLGVDCKTCPGGRENTILGTLHFGGAWPDNALNSTEISYPEILAGFHTFSVVWQPDRMVWSVDGRVFAEKRSGDWYTTSSDQPEAPFDKPFHLILNLAIGGGLAEERGLTGVSEEGFPKRMEVDWVRVWKCDSTVKSRDSCAWAGD